MTRTFAGAAASVAGAGDRERPERLRRLALDLRSRLRGQRGGLHRGRRATRRNLEPLADPHRLRAHAVQGHDVAGAHALGAGDAVERLAGLDDVDDVAALHGTAAGLAGAAAGIGSAAA